MQTFFTLSLRRFFLSFPICHSVHFCIIFTPANTETEMWTKTFHYGMLNERINIEGRKIKLFFNFFPMTAPPFRPYGSFQNPPTHSRLAEQCREILTGNNSNRQLFTLIHFSIVVEGRPEEGASLHKVDHCRPPTTNTPPTDQVNIVNVSSLLSSNLHFHVYSFLSLRFIERMKEAVNQSVQVRSTPRFTSVQTSVPLFRSVGLSGAVQLCCSFPTPPPIHANPRSLFKIPETTPNHAPSSSQEWTQVEFLMLDWFVSRPCSNYIYCDAIHPRMAVHPHPHPFIDSLPWDRLCPLVGEENFSIAIQIGPFGFFHSFILFSLLFLRFLSLTTGRELFHINYD